MERGTLFSDYHLMTFSVATRSNTANDKTKVIAYRKCKTIKKKVLANDISTSLSDMNALELALNDSAELYDKLLIDALDVVAPVKVQGSVIITQKLLKQIKSPVYSQTSFCGFHTEATSSGLWENIELHKSKMSTYQDETTKIVVLGQGCLGEL